MPRKKAPAAEAPRLVAYYRYSGGSRQTEQSIEGQRRDCEAYARAHGMTILREYVDRHISGKTDDRPAFQQLVADSAKHTFDAVICWKTDRLARNRYDSAVYKKIAPLIFCIGIIPFGEGEARFPAYLVFLSIKRGLSLEYRIFCSLYRP